MKFDRSFWLSILYCLFTLLYTVYVTSHHPAGHPGDSWAYKKAYWTYYLKFLLISGYLFFILQGLLLRSKNWGVLLLLPPALLVATIIAGFLVVWILRLGGGTLLDRDSTDMILATFCWLTGSFFAVRLIRAGRKTRK